MVQSNQHLASFSKQTPSNDPQPQQQWSGMNGNARTPNIVGGGRHNVMPGPGGRPVGGDSNDAQQPQFMNFQSKLSASQPQVIKKATGGGVGPQQVSSANQPSSMMSSGPQPSTSISSGGGGYNNMLRGLARESNSLHSAKTANANHSQQHGTTTAHAYQISQQKTVSSEVVNSLSINGVNEKLMYKAGQPMRVGDNSSNGYLIKSAQNTVKQMHQQQHSAANQFVGQPPQNQNQGGTSSQI